jgi:hypothetical protein
MIISIVTFDRGCGSAFDEKKTLKYKKYDLNDKNKKYTKYFEKTTKIYFVLISF